MMSSDNINQQGQSTIEFLFASFVTIGMIFVVFRLGLILSFASFAQYTVFMAARAYFSSSPTTDPNNTSSQFYRAQTVATLGFTRNGQPLFDFIIKPDTTGTAQNANTNLKGLFIGENALFVSNDRDFNWMTGVNYSFSANIFFNFPNSQNSPAKLSLIAEAYLGREETDEECAKKVKYVQLLDNGC